VCLPSALTLGQVAALAATTAAAAAASLARPPIPLQLRAATAGANKALEDVFVLHALPQLFRGGGNG